MPPTRRSTVWDYSDLRIHPDGTRVSSDPTTTRAPRYSAGSAQDFRGNWVARDAVGKGTIPPYRVIRTSIQDNNLPQDHNHHNQLGERPGGAKKTQENCLASESKELASQNKGKQKEKQIGPTDSVTDAEFIATNSLSKRRADRRRRFREDASYITGRNTRRTPLPTADLLKSIHLFASHHYTARGQLFDLANERRRFSKQFNLEGRNEGTNVNAETTEEPAGPVESKNEGDLQGEDYTDDMYRMFEGSALMAMGMLVQEYLAKVLRVQPPADWSDLANDETAGDEEEEEEEEENEPEDCPMHAANRQPELGMLEGLIQMSQRSSEVMDVVNLDGSPNKMEENSFGDI